MVQHPPDSLDSALVKQMADLHITPMDQSDDYV